MFCKCCGHHILSREKAKQNGEKQLSGDASAFEIVKIDNGDFYPLGEYSDDINDVSRRLDFLNGKSWNIIFMARKTNIGVNGND